MAQIITQNYSKLVGYLHKNISFIFSLALEGGWSPALLRSQATLDFIKSALLDIPVSFFGDYRYWIGGTSCSEQFSPFHYSLCDEAGKVLVLFEISCMADNLTIIPSGL